MFKILKTWSLISEVIIGGKSWDYEVKCKSDVMSELCASKMQVETGYYVEHKCRE